MKGLIPTLLCDFYKTSHREQYPEKTEVIYSTWIPRSGKFAPHIKEVVAFGFQGVIKEFLVEYFEEEFFGRSKEVIVAEYARYMKHCLQVAAPYTKHLEDLHDLGYLPLFIRAVDEGTLVPFRVPMLTIENTDPRFFWLTNYFETLLSAQLWKPSLAASTARVYRKILDTSALGTTGTTAGVEFQGHDFSMRGMSGIEDAARTGMGHLLSFVGTDTIPAIQYAEQYYNANIEKELVGCSVNATEHSVMCVGSKDGEYETYRRLIEDVYPTGIVSIVSDTWDLWKVLTTTIPQLKEKILARDGGEGSIDKVVIRPDSGDPVDIICGAAKLFITVDKAHTKYAYSLSRIAGFTSADIPVITVDGKYYKNTSTTFVKFEETTDVSPADKGVVELLWQTFGGTESETGYKVLDSHIGAIYGDAITIERCTAICDRLIQKGFATTNVVFGIGSYTYQYATRDTLGFAMKATSADVDGERVAIFKDPITDDGIKKSLVGRVEVKRDEDGCMVALDDNCTEMEGPDLLTPLYLNGMLVKETSLAEIRGRLL